MSLNYLVIGRRIRILRKRVNMTQQQLAEKIGTSTPYISQLERGERGLSVEHLVAIAKMLGVTADSILGNEQRHFPQQPDSDLSDIMRDCNVFEHRVLAAAIRELKRILRESSTASRRR